MTGPGLTPEQIARYLRQQGELGGGEFFFSGLTGDEAAALLDGDPSDSPSVKDGPSPGTSAQGASPAQRPSGSRSTQPTPLAQAIPTAEPTDIPGYDDLRAEALACRQCALAETRANVVFSDGNPGARLMVVGEAPGAQEDKTGRAFVGPAGKLLDLLLASVDLSRDETAYICNVLKCRPPGNRNPLPAEIETCTPFLHRQIEIISPEAILAVGTFSGQFLTGTSLALGKLRGEVYSYQGVPVVVTYHPAALLRNPGWTRATWSDLQLLRQVMDGSQNLQAET